MIDSQYVKYGASSGLLLLCTIMLSMSDDNKNSVFAQITPAPEKFGSNDDATDSSHDTGAGNGNPQTITPSEKSDETTKEDSTDPTDSNDVNSGQTATEQDDGTITTEEQNPDPTNQLVEAIMNEVNEALSASGITGP